MIKNNEKSNIFLILLFVAFVIIAGIILVIGGVVSDNIVNTLQDPEIIDSTAANATLNELEGSVVPIFDNMFFWFVIGLLITLLIIGFYTDFHPITIGLFIVVLLFAIYLAMQGANMLDDLKTETDTELQGEKSFTLKDAISGRILPVLFFIFSVIAIIIMYSRRSGGNF